LPILWWFARRSAVDEEIDAGRPTAVRVVVTVGCLDTADDVPEADEETTS
jgi:hypothetical protein